MSNPTVELPFKEYPSTLARYSNSDQLQAHQYKSIIESTLGEAVYERQHPMSGGAMMSELNANVPITNKSKIIFVDNNKNKPVNVYEKFWQYKTPAGQIFTDWTSAGVANLNTDLSVKDMPLHGHIQDSNLVLSNTNNVRNNLQRYGKEYLTSTNLLNSIAFKNGVSYESGNMSVFRTGTRTELEEIEHSSFGGKENGDLMSRQINQLDVDVPITYANNTRSYWAYINCAFIRPNNNPKLKVHHLKQKFGVFDLDSMKLTGISCLTKDFNVIPKGMKEQTDVYNDDYQLPPVSNPGYYSGINRGRKDGSGSNMYCSANTNYVTMPKNHLYGDLDTSFQVMPGNNSLTLGTVMSPKLKDFIQNELFNFNRSIVLMQIYKQYESLLGSDDVTKKLRNTYPAIFKHNKYVNNLNRRVPMYDYFMQLSEDQKYKFIFNHQRDLSRINVGHPELEIFINHLSIFKFGGNDVNAPSEVGKVLLREINHILDLHHDQEIEIYSPGCFLLLPTMMSEDVFGVRENIPGEFSGSVNQINRAMKDLVRQEHEDGYDNARYEPIENNPNECITDPGNYALNASNCAFRDSTGKWIQRPNPNYIPNMFNDPNNYNNDIYNLKNPYAGANPYDAPTTF